MADNGDLTEAEKAAAAALAAMRKPGTAKTPISASFRDRMASATVDPAATVAPPAGSDDLADMIIFRP